MAITLFNIDPRGSIFALNERLLCPAHFIIGNQNSKRKIHFENAPPIKKDISTKVDFRRNVVLKMLYRINQDIARA